MDLVLEIRKHLRWQHIVNNGNLIQSDFGAERFLICKCGNTNILHTYANKLLAASAKFMCVL